jgi:hypothetical protein
MMRFGQLACLMALLAVSASADARKPAPLQKIASGLYGNVWESEESGDRGGIEIRLFAEAKKPYVEAVVCESECNGEGRYYIRPTEKGFAFTWKNPRFKEDDPITFQVWKSGNSIWIEGMEDRWTKSELKPLRKPLGLYGYQR